MSYSDDLSYSYDGYDSDASDVDEDDSGDEGSDDSATAATSATLTPSQRRNRARNQRRRAARKRRREQQFGGRPNNNSGGGGGGGGRRRPPQKRGARRPPGARNRRNGRRRPPPKPRVVEKEDSGSQQEASEQEPVTRASFPFVAMGAYRSPKYYIVNRRLGMDENKFHEFKAVQKSRAIVNNILVTVERYMCAFANCGGGVIHFGVKDDGAALGVMATRKDRDRIRLGIDDCAWRVSPAVNAALYSVAFVPVVDSKEDAKAKPSEPWRVVVEIIIKGDYDPRRVYLDSSERLFVRREASTIELTGRRLVDFVLYRSFFPVPGEGEGSDSGNKSGSESSSSS